MIAHILKKERDKAYSELNEHHNTIWGADDRTDEDLERNNELWDIYSDLKEAYEDFMDNQWGSLNKEE